eukprot:14290135-Ditylum_brightwellii.AAC.1
MTRTGIGWITDVDTAIDQLYIDDGAEGDLHFSQVEQQDTAVKMTCQQLSAQSKSDPFSVEE